MGGPRCLQLRDSVRRSGFGIAMVRQPDDEYVKQRVDLADCETFDCMRDRMGAAPELATCAYDDCDDIAF